MTSFVSMRILTAEWHHRREWHWSDRIFEFESRVQYKIQGSYVGGLDFCDKKLAKSDWKS